MTTHEGSDNQDNSDRRADGYSLKLDALTSLFDSKIDILTGKFDSQFNALSTKVDTAATAQKVGTEQLGLMIDLRITGLQKENSAEVRQSHQSVVLLTSSLKEMHQSMTASFDKIDGRMAKTDLDIASNKAANDQLRVDFTVVSSSLEFTRRLVLGGFVTMLFSLLGAVILYFVTQ